jgi:uncharacterized protein (TIGR03083 family)
MQREELLTAQEEARANLDAALEGLTSDELQQAGVVGDWTIKDLLAHVTAWDVDLLTNLGKIQRGQKPGRTLWDSAGIQAQNDAWHAEFKDRPLERVLADYDGVHAQLLRRAESLPEAELNAPAPWLNGRPVYKYFIDHVVTHENEHAAELAAWRKGRAPGQ